MVSLSQERFVYDHLLGEEEPNPEVWQVPVSALAPPGATSASTVMDNQGSRNHSYPFSQPVRRLVQGEQRARRGFFRVNYTSEGLEATGSGHQRVGASRHR